LLEQRRETDAALEATRRILQHAPDHRGTRLLRASVLSERGEASAAISEFRDIAERVPDDAVAGSALLIALQHDPTIPANQIAEEHRAWAAKHMPVIAQAEGGDDPERPLRIGWISPRFFSGLVGNFFLPVLNEFDRASMTHILYDNGAIEDATNRAFREAADEWHRIDELDDAELCECIRSDRIDVIVELSGHSPGNRLRALASRPARMQVNWLDYFHSTGTNAIDVVISDTTLTPPELTSNYTEHVIWLPSGRLCYTPPAVAPNIEPRVEKPIRFCSFNRVDKLNDRVLASWSRILAGVPRSILRLKARAFDGVDDRRYFLARAQRLGIASDRLELIGYSDNDEMMRAYADCDIALDPFPFSGCATSFDALWMGLPVVTKIGDTMVSRQTASILHSLDLDECIATTEDDYVSVAIALATDKTRLQSIRLSLRARMRERVCDVARHARELGNALREAWRLSCRAR
jgi:predicted O-linked N-acetylglucosamine transferase (SPINDLY family)